MDLRPLDAALQYADMGWYVFPCRPKGKEPLTPHGFKNATRNREEVRSLWEACPSANVAISTGPSNLVVLDVDEKNGGFESLDKLAESTGDIYHTRRVKTGGGGLHLIYNQLLNNRVRNSAGKLGPGLDIRGDGGYIIAPPSIHPSGNPYTWWNVLPIAPFPSSLLSLLEEPQQPLGVVTTEGGMVEGGRNDYLSRRAYHLRKLNYTESAILKALLEENAARCVPPLSESEVKGIVARKRVVSPEATVEADIKPEDVEEWTVTASAVKPEKVPFLWSPYIPAGRLTLLSGNPGQGKTWLSLTLAAVGSVGGRLPGMAAPLPPFTTLYCSTEDSIEDTLVPRLIALGADLDRVKLLKPEHHIPLDQRGKWWALIKKTDAKLVVIDTLQAFMPKGSDINNMLSCRWTLRLFTDVLRETQAAGILIRHFRKQQDGDKLHRGAGSIDLTALVRSELALTLDETDQSVRYVEHIKSSAAAHGPRLSFRVVDGAVQWL